jgi:sulfite oxidase
LSRFGDVLLAYEMNGEPLPAQHGAPLRIIVPGHVGIRNVKWIKSITLSHEESHGGWQRGMAYKVKAKINYIFESFMFV